MNIENNLGKIKVNNTLFSKIIFDAISNVNDELFLCDQNLKIYSSNNKNKFNSFSNEIIVHSFDKSIDVTFFTIMAFGYSINKNSELILSYIIDELKPMFMDFKITIHMRVIGIKSKEIKKRDLEFVKSYEPK